MNTRTVLAHVREYLEEPANDSPLARAKLIDDVVHEVYAHVKRTQYTGLGLDGRDGGERIALAPLGDAATNYLDDVRAQTFQ